MEEGRQEQEQELELRALREEFRRPRDALLSLVSEFFSRCVSRLEVQKNHLPESLKITPTYFLDSKSHEVCIEACHDITANDSMQCSFTTLSKPKPKSKQKLPVPIYNREDILTKPSFPAIREPAFDHSILPWCYLAVMYKYSDVQCILLVLTIVLACVGFFWTKVFNE